MFIVITLIQSIYRWEPLRRISIELKLLQGAQKRESFLVYSSQQMSV